MKYFMQIICYILGFFSESHFKPRKVKKGHRQNFGKLE